MTGFAAPAGLDAGVPAVRVARALDCYRNNVDRVADWVHPSWIAASLGVPEARLSNWRALLANVPPGVAARCSWALVRTLGVTPPGFAALSPGGFTPVGAIVASQPNACLLDVVPAPLTMRIWRMRALLLRRGEVRRLIDRHAQKRLADWTGLDVDVLMSGPGTDSANDAARLAAVAMPPLASLDADALAIEGMLLVLRDLKSADGLPFPLSRLALPRYVEVPAWLNALPTQHDEAGTARLFRRLPELLREWAWLFG
ncbi:MULTISPECIES: type III secretion protein HrpB4 [Burkholderia]|uniref:type III secretion protein HrpB4 n=1 Tax=Burkholderia TaxID=32008 RepID=UPI000BBB35EE|nr:MULTISPECIES: type III secretion protein HrpB4 [Burkholderia]AXK62503.1 type III secretion protein HrpB4 [Burkholderia sp. IDO3]PCD63546.1 type III secretion protein HrpB4 [Burkholderia sp. IDO3]QTD94212.1 type III secretion protein HrpB4 [Burkholderia anthina]